MNDIGPFIPLAALQQIRTYVGLDPKFNDTAAAEAYLRAIHAGFGPLSDAQWHHLLQHSVAEDAAGLRLHYDPRIREAYATLAEQDIDLWKLWDSIRIPVLVLRGGSSALLTAEVAERMELTGPKAKLVTFPGIGHAPALMAEDQIATIVNWLTR